MTGNILKFFKGKNYFSCLQIDLKVETRCKKPELIKEKKLVLKIQDRFSLNLFIQIVPSGGQVIINLYIIYINKCEC